MAGKQAQRRSGKAGDVLSYAGYLQLDRILDAQEPLSDAPDELLFIVQHQTSELWMKLIIHELRAAIVDLGADRVGPAIKSLSRVVRIFAQLNLGWDVLRTMTAADYARFRDVLGKASGFQSAQYRAIEFLAGNRSHAALERHRASPEELALLEQIVASPSLHEAVSQLLARGGFDLGAAEEGGLRADGASLVAAWKAVYAKPDDHWRLYELAEKLLDFEDAFRSWRFNHVTTVERIIGFKRGTGGTSGVPYLRQLLEVELFPELWRVRSEL